MWGRKAKQIAELTDEVAVANASTLQLRDMLRGTMGTSHNGKRDTYDIYGYPERYYFDLGYRAIRREGMANRIAAGVPTSCWRNGFNIVDNLDDANPLLEDEVAALDMKQLFSRFERADVLNRIGRFSALLVGVPDGLELREPVGKVRGKGFESIYFRPFAYDGIQVSKYDTDETSERYGLPELYQLQIIGRGDTEKTQQPATVIAHHSRVIHMAESLLDSDIEGIPALEPVYNRILDLDKVLGGSAEAYFRNARTRVAYEIDKDFAPQLIADQSALDKFNEGVRKFTNEWQDHTVATGATVKAITTQHSSPEYTVKALLWEISGYTGIPMRILTGEGAGQLAGSEDRLTYNALVNDRQSHTCAQWVRSLFGILEVAGMVKLPDTYEIHWPLDPPLNAIDEAGIALTQSQTLKNLTEAASTAGGDGIELESALDHFGMSEIDVEEADDLDPAELGMVPPEPGNGE